VVPTKRSAIALAGVPGPDLMLMAVKTRVDCSCPFAGELP
jgi:hypothetical protein